MSSSGLIYAVIVGAWAAYLVPMWLRRQDELNESRPTERFSTAIRLLAGRSALERRAARNLDVRTGTHDTSPRTSSSPEAASGEEPDHTPPQTAETEAEAVTAGARPIAESEPARPVAARREAPHHPSLERRARLLARRRRMVTLLFLWFAVGAVVAAVFGVAFIWAPAAPAILLTIYIGHLRRLERQRYEVKIDRARAAQAAERLQARERARHSSPHDAAHPDDPGHAHLHLSATPGNHTTVTEPIVTSVANAVAEATEHEEWVDGMRESGAVTGPNSWEPVPVPLPTYVTAPVAPRTTRNLDLAARHTWDSGRPTTEPRKTPLFDQYADPAEAADYPARPRAANE